MPAEDMVQPEQTGSPETPVAPESQPAEPVTEPVVDKNQEAVDYAKQVYNQLAGTETPEPEPVQTEPDAAKDEDKADAVTTPSVSAEAIDKAAEALRKVYEWDDEVIASLPPERVIELGAVAGQKAEAETAAATNYEKFKEFFNRFHRESNTTDPAQGAPDQPPEADPTPAVDPFSQIEQELGAETAAPLRKAFDAQSQAIQSTVDRLVAEQVEKVKESFQDSVNRLTGMFHDSQFNNACDRNADSIPELSTPETRRAVYNRAAALAKAPGLYVDEAGGIKWGELVRDAAALELRKNNFDNRPQRISERYKLETQGQPGISDTSGRQQAKTMSPQDKAAEAYKLLSQGLSREEAEKQMQQRTG